MSAPTAIEWADISWNPVSGCDKVSPGCDHCYAETIATRFAGTKAYPNGFGVTLKPERLTDPLRKRSWRGKRVFVNSMSDLFHAQVPDDYIAHVFAVMALAPEVTFQLLTKRHGRLRSLLRSTDFWRQVGYRCDDAGQPDLAPDRLNPSPNLWVGVSVEDQARADLRIPALLQAPAAVRFLSCEPLLGPINFANLSPHSFLDGLDWVIVGGESGTGARPMHPDWARSIRDQCAEAGVPYLFKQWGEWAPDDGANDDRGVLSLSDNTLVKRVGKKAAGRVLDGRTWDEFPAERAS